MNTTLNERPNLGLSNATKIIYLCGILVSLFLLKQDRILTNHLAEGYHNTTKYH